MADYPSSIPGYGQTGFHNTSNLGISTLSADITDVSSSLTVGSATTKTTWPLTNFVIIIEDELIFVGSRSGNVLSSLVRGFGGTVAAAHLSGETVIHVLDSADIQKLKDELIAGLTKIGVTGSENFVLVAGDTMTGALAMGSNKITGLAQATASGDAVHGARSITAGNGLTGGGDLTADRTIDIVPASGSNLMANANDLDWTGVKIQDAGVDVATRPIINLIEGSNTTFTIVENSGADRVDVTINSASGSSGLDVEDEGTPLGVADTLDFTGAGVTVTYLSGVATIDIPGGGGGTLTVKEVDGSPTDTDVTVIQVNQSEGLTLTDNGAGDVTIGTTTSPAASSILVGTGRSVISGSGLTGGGDLSADRTLAVGAGTGITVNADDVAVDQSFSPTWSGTHSFQDTTKFNIIDQVDPTKKLQFNVNGTTGITGMVATAFTTAKTVTLPDATDTLVGKDTTDTLTNKIVTSTTNNVAAKSLHSATTVVDVSAATAPSSGQALVATSSTAATWQDVATQTELNTHESDTTTHGTTGNIVGTSDSQTLTNKTLTSSTNVLGGVTLTLDSDATGDVYYRNSGGLLTRLPIGSSTEFLGVTSGLPDWKAVTVTPVVTALTDGATVALDASLGDVFTLSAAGNRTILVPTNAVDGKKIIIRHTASGGARTLSLTTGSAGAFRFGADIPNLTSTSSGLTDYIGAIYNGTASRWDVISYSKGF